MPVDGDFGDEPSEPIDRLVIALRAYVRKAPKKPKKGSKPPRTTLPGAVNWRDLAPRTTPSDWVLVFDCETRTTPISVCGSAAISSVTKGRFGNAALSTSPRFSPRMSSRSFDNS